MDVGHLHTDIHSAQQSDTHSLEIIAILSRPNADPHWSLDGSGLLRYDGRVWVPDVNDLCLRILLNNHDHPVLGHFGQNMTFSSDEIILGQVLGCLLRTIVSHAQLV